MAETVKIIIEAVDKASKEIQSIDRTLNNFASNMAKGVFAGGIAAGAAAVYGLTNVLLDSVQGAMEAQAAQAQLAQTIKSTGEVAGISTDDINAWADALSKTTAVEDDAIVKASSVLLTFTKINKDVFPRALELTLDMSRAFGQDLQASVIQLGKALNDPIEGLGALQRIGVQFSESQVALIKTLMGDSEQLDALAKAANKARGALPDLRRDLDVASLKLREMEASGKKSESQLLAQKYKVEELSEKIKTAEGAIKDYDDAQKSANTGMSEAERLAKAQGVVMDELTRQVGGSAEAFGDTFAGKLESFKNEIGNIKDRIGTALIPALQTLVEEVGPKVIEWADKLAEWIETDGAKAIQDFADWITTDLVPAFETKLIPAVQEVIKFIENFLTEDSDQFVEVWKNVQKAIEDLQPVFDTLAKAVQDISVWWDGVTAAIQRAIDKLREWLGMQPAGPAGGGSSGAGNAPLYTDPTRGVYHQDNGTRNGGNYMPWGMPAPAPITVNVNIAGNADPRTTRGAVLDALQLARARGMV